jgi:trans-2,3-dihydro-3-hydroxyanthranilate isomerase
VEALSRLKVNHDQATPWLRDQGARWFYVTAPELNQSQSSAQQYRARMQFYNGEDPATGSAAGCAISHWVARGAVDSGERILLRQGVEMGRPSDIWVSARSHEGTVTDVRVGGSTVLVAKARLFLP